MAVRRSGGPAVNDPGDRLTVEAVLETWRLDDEWWRVAIVRRYHDVMLEGGKHVMLFEDLTNGTWWLQKP